MLTNGVQPLTTTACVDCVFPLTDRIPTKGYPESILLLILLSDGQDEKYVYPLTPFDERTVGNSVFVRDLLYEDP